MNYIYVCLFLSFVVILFYYLKAKRFQIYRLKLKEVINIEYEEIQNKIKTSETLEELNEAHGLTLYFLSKYKNFCSIEYESLINAYVGRFLELEITQVADYGVIVTCG